MHSNSWTWLLYGKCLGVELLDYVVNECLTFKANVHLLSKYHFTSLPATYGNSSCPASCLHFILSVVLIIAILVCVCVLPSHCHFCLYLPNDSNDKWRQASYVLIVYLYTFLVKCLFKYVKNGIFLLLLSWGSCLYILDTNPFSESCVLVACLFIL